MLAVTAMNITMLIKARMVALAAQVPLDRQVRLLETALAAAHPLSWCVQGARTAPALLAVATAMQMRTKTQLQQLQRIAVDHSSCCHGRQN